MTNAQPKAPATTTTPAATRDGRANRSSRRAARFADIDARDREIAARQAMAAAAKA